jgi:hypothetical protein
MFGGDAGNNVSFAGFGPSDQVSYHSGAGTDQVVAGVENDTFFVNGPAKLTGGGGSDNFVFQTIHPVTISDFGPSSDAFVFSNSAFDLGVDNNTGSATFQEIDPGLYSALGNFTSSNQRFAYDQSTGDLYYSPTGHSNDAVLIADLTNHPQLTIHDFMFTI